MAEDIQDSVWSKYVQKKIVQIASRHKPANIYKVN